MQPAYFIHVPRTAGHSVRNALDASGRSLQFIRTYARTKYFDPDVTFITFMHLRVEQLLEMNVFDRDWLSSRFVFGFVRNPWQRLVSIWTHLQFRKYHNLRKNKPFMNVPDTFSGFIDLYPGEWGSGPGQNYNSQISYFRADGKNIADFIGRYENLQTDWLVVCENLGIAIPLPPAASASKAGRTRSPNYRDHYTPELRERVRKLCEEDIDVFGYTF